MKNRRGFFRSASAIAAAVSGARLTKARGTVSAPDEPPIRVQTPDVNDLPFKLDNGVKVFHLVAEPVKQQIAPGRMLDLWGFNGSAPGPTIQITQGDRVRIIVENHLPEPTSMHWHGFEIPHAMDGGPGISQDPIPPGGRFVYEFTLHQAGTFFYHSHMAMQEMIGMLGAFIMHPKVAYAPRVDKDFVVLLQEYAVLPNNSVPNTMNMEFNWLVLNGKAAPSTTPLIVRLGDRVRIRLINLGMDHHPIHLHGHTFQTTGTEGGRIPEAAWAPGNTVLVGVAQSRDIEFTANNPGRLDAALPLAASHDEPNVFRCGANGSQRTGHAGGHEHESGHGHARGNARSADGRRLRTEPWARFGRGFDKRSDGGERWRRSWRHAAHARPDAGDADAAECPAERRQRAGLSTGRLHGRTDDGDGRNGRATRKLRSAPGLERIHAGHDELRTCLAAGSI